MKIGFITDTNILTKMSGKDNKKDDTKLWSEKSFLEKIDFFINYIEDMKKINYEIELVYLIPETVIQELECQKIEAYNKAYKNFKKTYDKLEYGFKKGKMPENNISAAVKEEENVYLDKVKIIKLKYETKIFKELVNEAINKLPPFNKEDEGKKSDSGFKDALIWKTLLYSEEVEEFDKIYFFSGDSIFKNNSVVLTEQFKRVHKSTQLIIEHIKQDNEKLQNCLKTIINDNELPETDYIKLYDKEVILKFISKLKYNFDKIVKLKYNVWGEEEILLKELLFENFTEENINIIDVKKEKDKFIVEVKFETKKYILQPKEAIVFPPRSIKGIIRLNCQKENDEIILKDYKIITVSFEKTLQEQAQEWANSVNYITQLSGIPETLEKLESLKSSIKPLQQMRRDLGIDLYDNCLSNANDDLENYEKNNENESDCEED